MNLILEALKAIRYRLLCLLGVSLIAAGCNSAAVKDSSTGNQLANNKTGEVCRNVEVTGTRFKKRNCKSAEAWAAIDEALKEDVDDYKRRVTEQSSITAPGSVDSSGGRTISPVSY